ncbi:Uncharacterised protein [Klebsiella pneumoniae]|nr:Uncharacterised protein [Klebsiella pneumoniae]
MPGIVYAYYSLLCYYTLAISIREVEHHTWMDIIVPYNINNYILIVFYFTYNANF